MTSDEKEEEFYDCDEASLTTPPEFSDAQDQIATNAENVTSADEEPGQSEPVSNSDQYAVDETHLKELETLMTEEDRKEHHQKSLDIKKEGNALFGEKQWEEAAKCYTRALLQCPPSFANARAILYSNRAACFIKMDQQEQAIGDCSKAIELDSTYLKAYFRRAQLYEMKEDTWDKALEDYQTVLRQNPDDNAARAASIRLPPMINERNERMKAEMIEKLKGLGNMLLRPFGLSTENFKLQPNAEGGYSVQMKK